jgi:transcriptional regulator with XRE-family HTH domain
VRRTKDARALAVAMVHYRAERNLSQEELAGLIGMTTAQIAGLEAGDANPSARTLITISAQLGIEPGALR